MDRALPRTVRGKCNLLLAARTETSSLEPIEPGQRKRQKRDAIMRVGPGAVEIVKRGVARYDFRDPYRIAIELSWKEFALTFIGLELGINTAFALLYLASPGCIANVRAGSFSDAFFFSIETLATVGYGTMTPATFYGHVVSAIEIVSGLIFTAIMTGLLFVRFSKPRPKILFADQAVVTSHNCTPTLMVRIANGRITLLTNAMARLGESDARLILTIEAHDQALGAAIHDLRIYTAGEVLYGMHYAEVVTVDDRLRPVADLTRLSLVEPDPSARPN
jgi:inward rectifier potassium channel